MICIWLGLLAALATPFAANPPAPVTVGTLLRQESEVSTLPLLRNWVSRLQSSYDRTGGNADFGNFTTQNGKVATLLDADGPGAVVRLWTANPQGELKVYIDNAPRPVIDVPFAKLFDGSVPPFTAPLSGTSSGGFYSYLPLPYAHHCRITVDNPGPLYYHVNYLTYPGHTPVTSFALPLSAEDQAAEARVASAWTTPVWPAPGLSRTQTIAAGQTKTLEQDHGPGVVEVVQVTAPAIDDASLRRLVLRAYFDAHRTPDIVAPLSDFFGNAYRRGSDFSSLLLRHQGDIFAARFPMPFRRSARFSLQNGNSAPVTLTWAEAVSSQPFPRNRVGYFHAQWRQEVTQRAVPHLWVSVRGRHGHLIGIVQTMDGPHGLTFLEGDDQVRVDDEQWLPSQVHTTVIGPWNGTGTEDFFDSGWYFQGGINALPMNGVRVRDDAGRIDAYRWLLNDAPVFQSSLDAQIEHGGANDAPGVYYSSVAYWYDNGSVTPWSGMPGAQQIRLPASPIPRFAITGAIEGEAMVSKAQATAGSVQVQEMGGFPGQWSHDQQLWWVGGKLGDTLTLSVTPPAAGTYDVIGYFTKAADYGRFSFTLAGQPLPVPLDAFHNGVIPTGPLLLGRVHLPAGMSAFVVTITGKNAASQNMLFGLDALLLRPAH